MNLGGKIGLFSRHLSGISFHTKTRLETEDMLMITVCGLLMSNFALLGEIGLNLRGGFGKFLAWSFISVTDLQTLSCLVSSKELSFIHVMAQRIIDTCYG